MDCSARRRLLTGHVTHAARQPIRLRTADCAGVVFGVSKPYCLETHGRSQAVYSVEPVSRITYLSANSLRGTYTGTLRRNAPSIPVTTRECPFRVPPTGIRLDEWALEVEGAFMAECFDQASLFEHSL